MCLKSATFQHFNQLINKNALFFSNQMFHDKQFSTFVLKNVHQPAFSVETQLLFYIF